jgi:hypothetical protein
MLRHLAMALGIAACGGTLARADPVDLELVLAVDASSSIDIGEYGLELRGIARGFRDPAVREAIRSGPTRRIAVNVVIWGQQRYAKQWTGWYVLSSDADADAFADLVQNMPRKQFGGTGIGEAIAEAVHAIADNEFEGPRGVIDVSGDGRETGDDMAISLREAREEAGRFGITVNGLAVTNEDQGLLRYYRERVITGNDSFALSATDYIDFEVAMRRKLYREINSRPQVSMGLDRRD